MVTNTTLQKLIQAAYDLPDNRVSGGPTWVNSEGYDIDAKADKSAIDELHKLSAGQRSIEQQRMIQALLADRFKLVLQRETKEVSGYALVIAKSGSRLQEAKFGDTYPNGLKDPQGRPLGAGFLIGPGTEPGPEPCQLIGQGVSIRALVGLLSERFGRSII